MKAGNLSLGGLFVLLAAASSVGVVDAFGYFAGGGILFLLGVIIAGLSVVLAVLQEVRGDLQSIQNKAHVIEAHCRLQSRLLTSKAREVDKAVKR